MKHRGFSRTFFVLAMGVAFIFAPAFCQAPALVYTITTFAGNGVGGYTADAVAATTSQLNNPLGLALDSSGHLFIADSSNHRVREVSGGTISTVAGDGTLGYTGDAAAATSAELNLPSGVAVDSSGTLYIADTANYVIRKVAGTTITTYAGSNSLGKGGTGDHGPATSARLDTPTGLALDAAGNLYIADSGNNAIRIVTKATGNITTLSTGNFILKSPKGVAVDAAGNVYIADTNNSRILKVTTVGSITKTTTVAGNSTVGSGGDGGPATSAQLNYPYGVAVDAAGNIYIADTNNQRVRTVSAATGIIATVAGTGRSGYVGDGGPATSAQLSFPRGILLDASGNIYISDAQNNAVRLLTPAPPSIGGVVTASAFGGFKSIAPGTWIEIYGSNLAAGSRAWTGADFTGAAAPTSLDGTKVTIGGQPAFVGYISPGQVNAVVPSNVATGVQQITVTAVTGTSAAYAVIVNPTAAGMLAPGYLNIGGVQYLGALFPDFQTFVAPPGAVSGYASRRARPGDVIVIFGIGFGPVTSNLPAGQLAPGDSTLTLPLQIYFGSTLATLQYSGLAPALVGVYQFNVVVPNVPASDAVPVSFSLNGVIGAQVVLYTSVGN